jgi:hypothetical protein
MEYDKEKEDLNASDSFSHSTVSSRGSSMEASTEPMEEAEPTELLGCINLMNDTLKFNAMLSITDSRIGRN